MNWKYAPCFIFGFCFVGCTTSNDAIAPAVTPHVTGVSATNFRVGGTLEITGKNFAHQTDVTFEGRYTVGGAPIRDVNVTIPFETNDPTKITWEQVGGVRSPFDPEGNRPGVFEGTIWATNHFDDGLTVIEPVENRFTIELPVESSLVVKDFRAVGPNWIADCKYPTSNAIRGLTYLLRVGTIGFTPTKFEYELSPGFVVDGTTTMEPTVLEHIQTDNHSPNEHAILVQMAEIPEYTEGYRASIRIRAFGKNGKTYDLTHAFAVRNPLQMYYEPAQLAELFTPVRVSECISGGPNGTEAQYTESSSESRTRSVSRSVRQGWEVSYAEQHSATWGTLADVQNADAQDVGVLDTTNSSLVISSTRLFSLVDKGLPKESLPSEGWSTTDPFGHIAETRKQLHFVSKGGEVTITDRGLDNAEPAPLGANSPGSQSGSALLQAVTVGATATSIRGPELGYLRMPADADETWSPASYPNTTADFFRTQTFAEANSTRQRKLLANTPTFVEALGLHSEYRNRIATEPSFASTVVSSAEASSLEMKLGIIPNSYAVFYRQKGRLLQQGGIAAYDLCGNASLVATSSFEDWAWAPGFGLSEQCPPAPQSFQPQARCFTKPCAGGN